MIYSLNIHHEISEAQAVLPCGEWGVAASQLDLQSLTTLYIAGCSRLQLGSPLSHVGFAGFVSCSVLSIVLRTNGR